MNDEICQKDLSEDIEDKREVYSDTDNEFQKKIQELEKQGVRVVKLPGKAHAVKESLRCLLPELVHAVKVIK